MRPRRRAAASSGRSVFGANAFLKPMLSSLRFKQNGSHSYSAPARCAAPHKVAIPKRQRAIFHRIECRRKIVILSALHRQHRWPGVGRCSDCLDLYSRLASCHAAELREGFLARSNASNSENLRLARPPRVPAGPALASQPGASSCVLMSLMVDRLIAVGRKVEKWD